MKPTHNLILLYIVALKYNRKISVRNYSIVVNGDKIIVVKDELDQYCCYLWENK